MRLSWSDLVEFLEQLASVELSVVHRPEPLNGHVDALGVASTEKFHQFAGPIHGLLLDLDRLGFVASWFYRDHVS